MKNCLLVIVFLLLLTGCGIVSSEPVNEVKKIMDVSQFSRITPQELKAILSEPVGEYNEKWTNPGTGQEYDLLVYDYEIEGYYIEFLVIDDKVVRMNTYTQENEDNEFILNENSDIFTLIGIEPRSSLITVEDNNIIARYSSVSDQVGEVWAVIENKEVLTLKVTYNLNYFN